MSTVDPDRDAPDTPVERAGRADRADRSVRTPLLVRLAVVGTLVAVVAVLARDLWFFDDDWDYLTTRSIGDPDSWLEDHAGHWTMWTVPVFRVLYGLVGMDYFPWYHLPRLAALAGLALLIWRVLERRGASPVVAGAATAVFCVLDTSAGHRAISIGNYLVMMCLILVGEQLVDDERPVTTRRRLVVAGLLVVAVTAFSTGPMLLVATGISLLIFRRLRNWWPSLVPAAVIYGAWYLAYRPERNAELSPDPLGLPFDVLDVLGVCVGSLLGVSDTVGTVIGVGLIVLLLWLAWKRSFDLFDVLALGTGAIFLVVTAQLRGASEFALEDRYAFVPIITVGLVLVPRIRVPASRVAAGALALVAVALFAVNLQGTRDRTQELAEFTGERRGRVETAAALLADGQPAVEDSWVSVPLTVEGLQRLVDDGWRPPADPSREEEARGFLAIGVGPSSDEDVPEDLDELGTGDDCITAVPGGPVTITTGDPLDLLVSAPPDERLVLTWEADGARGTRGVTLRGGRGQINADVGRIAIAVPEDGTVTVTVDGRPGVDPTVCTEPG